jgi:hypothetical protein
MSLVAELYIPAALFFAASLSFMLRWNLSGDQFALIGSALIFGLGLGIHISIILLLPGMLWLAFSRREKHPGNLPGLFYRPWLILATAGAGAGGFLVYLYLPIRYLASPTLDYARDYWRINLATWPGFWWMLSGKMFGSLFFGVKVGNLPYEAGQIFYRMWSNSLGLGLIMGIFGLCWGHFKAQGGRVALGLMLAGYLAFYIPYQVVDKEIMIAPVYMLTAICAGIGASRLSTWIGNHWSAYRLIPLIVLLLLNVNLLVVNFPHLDLHRDNSARMLAEQNFSSLDKDSIYFGTWRDIPVMEYLQLVEQQRPDVRLRNLVFLSVDRRSQELDQAISVLTPVYTSSPDWPAPAKYHLLPVENCDCFKITEK